MDEKKLIKRIKSGDRYAFDELVREYQTKVIHIAYAMLSDYEEANDAAQETFVKVYRFVDNFRHDSSLSTWIYRITKNVCLDFLRKRKEATISIDEENEDGKRIEIEDSSKTPEKIAEENERRKLLRKALAELDDNSRMMITLYELEGMSYDEIADILKIPVGTVKSRLNRAREKLKKILFEKRELFF